MTTIVPVWRHRYIGRFRASVAGIDTLASWELDYIPAKYSHWLGTRQFPGCELLIEPLQCMLT